jgi:hypothetical protein
VTEGPPARVEFVDPEPNGLAAMLGGLIQANLAAHPERAALLRPATVGILVVDAGVSVTLGLTGEAVSVTNDLVGSPEVVIRTDSETLTELSAVPLRFGFPDAMTAEGRAITGKLLRGDLRVSGLLRHPAIVSRLNRLLSVA